MKKYLTQTDILKESNARGILDYNQKSLLRSLLRGEQGEDELHAILKPHLPPHWHVFRNIWLDHYRQTEVDFLIITPTTWWALEAKNYEGPFKYDGKYCYNKGLPIRDEIAANYNRKSILESIAQKSPAQQPTVETVMLFMDNECDLDLTAKPDFPLAMRYRAKRHIKEFIANHNHSENKATINQSINLLKKYEIDSPIKIDPLAPEDFPKLKKGIYCESCQTYQHSYHHHYLTCTQCGHRETKTHAILRTACDLGTLYYNQPKIINVTNIHHLINYKIPKKGIGATLKRHLPSYNKHRWTYYHNYGLPLNKIVSLPTTSGKSKEHLAGHPN